MSQSSPQQTDAVSDAIVDDPNDTVNDDNIKRLLQYQWGLGSSITELC